MAWPEREADVRFDRMMESERLALPMRVLTVLAGLALLLPIGIQFIGEESVYAFFLENMMKTGDALHAFYRPPLFLWAAWGIKALLGDVSPEIPLRLVSIGASWLGALVAAAFARESFGGRHAPWLAALGFLLVGEVQFWYGWLGYADAMFHCFVFASMTSAWLAARRRSLGWLAAGVAAANLAFMTKSLIAYTFFFSTLGLAAWMFGAIRFVLRPASLLILSASLAGPWFWEHAHGGNGGATASLMHDIAMRFNSFDPLSYLRHMAEVGFQFTARTLPVLALVAWHVIARKEPFLSGDSGRMLVVLGVNLLPFLLAPQSGMRHLVPLYGWASLILTWWALHFDARMTRRLVMVATVTLALKVPYSFAALPYLKEHGPNHAFRPIVQEVAGVTRCKAGLRLADDSFVGFSVMMYYSRLCHVRAPLRFLAAGDQDVYVFAYDRVPQGRVVKAYEIFGGKRYLEYIGHAGRGEGK